MTVHFFEQWDDSARTKMSKTLAKKKTKMSKR